MRNCAAADCESQISDNKFMCHGHLLYLEDSLAADISKLTKISRGMDIIQRLKFSGLAKEAIQTVRVAEGKIMDPHKIQIHFAQNPMTLEETAEFIEWLTDDEWNNYLKTQSWPNVKTREDFMRMTKKILNGDTSLGQKVKRKGQR